MARDIGPADGFAWDSDPPTDRGPAVPIIRAVWEAGYLCCLLSPKIEGVWMHSIEKRDTPCLGPTCRYKTASGHLERRWKGYYPAVDFNSGKLVLAEITHGAWLDWVKLGEPKTMPARGITLMVKRLTRNKNGKVRMEFRPGGMPEADLPACFDVRRALVRIWTGDDRPGETDNGEGK